MMSDEQRTAFKTSVKLACIALVKQRCTNAELAMQQAQDSANNQEKSSAGDKYETSRAMGQSDRDMNARQLQEAQKDLAFLNAINTTVVNHTAAPGSVIELGGNLFFIAIGLGPVKAEDKTVMVISHKSPLFEQLKNKKAGDTLVFLEKEQKVMDVF
jgi:hypothetical protein